MFGPRHVHPDEIIGVVDKSHLVGLGVIHAVQDRADHRRIIPRRESRCSSPRRRDAETLDPPPAGGRANRGSVATPRCASCSPRTRAPPSSRPRPPPPPPPRTPTPPPPRRRPPPLRQRPPRPP